MFCCFFSHPFCPGLGALLLKVRVCLCLNLGGPFLGVVGPVAPPGARALPAGGLAFILDEGDWREEGDVPFKCHHFISKRVSSPLGVSSRVPL